jgi:carbamoyl-phosphate synthase large subunit
MLDEKEVDKLVNYYQSLNLKYNKEYGFHVSMDRLDKDLCKQVQTNILDTILPRLDNYLENYKAFVANYIIKESYSLGFVPAHQDWSFVDKEDEGYYSITCWTALVDTNIDNGCMSVIKGSNTFMKNLRPSPSPQIPVTLSEHKFSIFPYFKTLDMKAGETLFFDSRTFHASPPNTTSEIRLAASVGITQNDADLVHYYFKPDGKENTNQAELLAGLERPSWNRLFMIYDAMKLGISIKTIQKLTRIDMWFLEQIEQMIALENEVSKYKLETISKDLLYEAKQMGYADRQMAHLLKCLESEVYSKRKEFNINRVFKMVDTCAAEFEAKTPYYYSTFEDENESVRSDKKKVVILGSGPNRIGQGIEFDYSCVHGVLAAKEMGYETIMINCNPETVSTDFSTADKLYFEPVFWEHIYDIILHEKPEGVIVQLGGQTALKLAEKLERYGIKIIGTDFKSLDLAEDRGAFSNLLKENEIPYPKFGVIEDAEEAITLSKTLGFPLLVRPSYVLGGQSMKIVINEEELEQHVVKLLHDLPGNQVLLDHFLQGAIEAEADAICDGKDVYIVGIMEHIEPAGIHSGDSFALLPTFSLSDHVLKQIENHTKKIAVALKTVGLINIQFAVKDELVYIIEANPRASRTVPFIAKAYDEPYVNYATKVMLGAKVKDFTFTPKKKGYAIKIPVFSYDKFPEVQKELGPEMKSTGEAIYFIDDLNDEYFQNIYSERNLYLSK